MPSAAMILRESVVKAPSICGPEGPSPESVGFSGAFEPASQGPVLFPVVFVFPECMSMYLSVSMYV